MSDVSSQIDSAIECVRSAADKFKPVAIVGLFSGGHDSLTANIVAHEAGADCSLHINTETGVPQTREFVFSTCDKNGWRLREYKAGDHINAKGDPDPQSYRQLVLDHGFPGPFMHRKMYNRLKERQLSHFERDIGATSNKPVIYVSGMRTEESVRRMGNMRRDAETGTSKEGRRVWVAPIHDFSKSDCGRCISACGMSRNPVVDLIHKSGECLCGAFADRNELDELRVWFPDVARKIDELEREVVSKWPWRWGDGGPPVWFREKQKGQEFFEFHGRGQKMDMPQNEPLCHRCNINKLQTA